jgi:hypothetical protein
MKRQCIKVCCANEAPGCQPYCDYHTKMYQTIPDPGPTDSDVAEKRRDDSDALRHALVNKPRGFAPDQDSEYDDISDLKVA